MDRTDEQQAVVDKKDYIDIMAYVRAFFRSARRYLILGLALTLFMTVCVTGGMAVVSKKLVKSTYTANGSFTYGVQLSDSLDFNYLLSGSGINKSGILDAITNSTKNLLGSRYMTLRLKEELGMEPDDKLNGEISIDNTYLTNMMELHVTSDSKEDAEAIRDAFFACYQDALYPVMGNIELNINHLDTKENTSSFGFLANPAVWIALGIFLGTFMYLGLIFLFILFRSNLETPQDVSEILQIPCLGQLPVNKGKKNDYKKSFVTLRRRISEEAEKNNISVLLFTGINNRKVQSAVVLELESDLQKQGKKVVLTKFDEDEESLTPESVKKTLDELRKDAELVLIDGVLCGRTAAPLVLADCSDAVIYMIEQGNAPPQKVKDMYASLQYAQAEPMGFVLDNCNYISTN